MKTGNLKICTNGLIDLIFCILVAIISICIIISLEYTVQHKILYTLPILIIISIFIIQSIKLVALKFDGQYLYIKNSFIDTKITFKEISTIELKNLSRPPIGNLELYSGKKYIFKIPMWLLKNLEPMYNCKTIFEKEIVSRYKQKLNK